MDVLHDTRTVRPLDRFEYYVQAGAAAELAPVEISGREPRRLQAMMSSARVGDFAIEALNWAADTEITAHRTARLIRASDPECLRIFLSVHSGVRAEQAGSRVAFDARDIALYDLSCPWQATHPAGQVSMQTVMLTFPRALVPVTRAAIRPLTGTVMPRNLPGRSLIARFLISLARTAAGHQADPDLAGTLRECVTGLICERLGQPGGITPRTRPRGVAGPRSRRCLTGLLSGELIEDFVECLAVTWVCGRDYDCLGYEVQQFLGLWT
jgi:AraC-binding-like domain